MGDRKIVFADELLQQVAAGLNRLGNVRLECVKVTFKVEPVNGPEDQDYEFGLTQALDVLANDLHWDERGDWSSARIATVEAI